MSACPDLSIYVENLDGGGVQVVCWRLATALVDRGYRVELVVTAADGILADRLPAEIAVVQLPASSRWRAAATALGSCVRAAPTLLRATLMNPEDDHCFKHLNGLAAYLERRRPAVLLAATPYKNLEALLARRLSASSARVFVSEHNDLRGGHPLSVARHQAILGTLQGRLYPEADGIIAVSAGVADDIARRAGIDRHCISVIYNPVVTPEPSRLAAEPVVHPWLQPEEPPVVLAVGRLGAAKDLPMLVRAFGRLRRRRLVRLIILGKDRSPRKTEKRIAALKALAGEFDAADDLDFPGYAANPFAWMARAGVLAVSSRNEGFCNVLAEALACGCPVVSTDCPSGPAEILDGGRYGRLVPVGDDAAMAEALDATLSEPRDEERLRARAGLFSVKRAADAYERLLFPAIGHDLKRSARTLKHKFGALI